MIELRRTQALQLCAAQSLHFSAGYGSQGACVQGIQLCAGQASYLHRGEGLHLR